MAKTTLQNVPSNITDQQLRQFLTSLRNLVELREGQRGTGDEQFITAGRLRELGINPNNVYDLTEIQTTGSACTKVPQPPRNLVIQNRIFSNYLTWDLPEDDTVVATEIWRSATSSRSDAKMIGLATIPVSEFPDKGIDLRVAYYYWIRTVTKNGCYSVWEPSDAQGGYLVDSSEGISIQEMLTLLTGNISEDQLVQTLLDRINLIDTSSLIFSEDIMEEDIYGGAITNVIDIGRYTLDNINNIEELFGLNNDRILDLQALEAAVSEFAANDYYPGQTYIEGKYVRYGGIVYKAKIDVPINTPPPNATYWEESPDIVTLVSNVESRVDTLEGEIVNKVDQIDYDTLNNTVIAHGTSITQNANSITSKASQTDLLLVEGIVSDHTTAIEQNATSISLSANAITGPITFLEDIYDDEVFVLNPSDVVGVDTRVTRAQIVIDEHEGILLQHTDTLINLDGDIRSAESSIQVLSNADDVLQSQINLKATIEDLNGLDIRVGGAETTISTWNDPATGLQAQINDKVAIATYNGLDARVGAAESTITAWDDPSTGLGAQIQDRVEIQTYTDDQEALDTRIGQAETTLDTHETELGTIQSEWTVKLNANGQVAGVGLISDEVIGSEFVVLADKFLVVKPDGTGTATPMFVVGDIDGVTAVGVHGNLIIDGTIATRHIDAQSITATHIGTNEIIANSANIKDGIVTNAKITNLDATKITTGTLDAGRIGATSITADKLDVDGATFNNVTVKGTVDSAQIKSSYFDVGDLKILTESGGGRYCSIIASNNTDFSLSGTSFTVTVDTDAFYASGEGSGYNSKRVARTSQVYNISILGSNNNVNQLRVKTYYSINNGSTWNLIDTKTATSIFINRIFNYTLNASSGLIKFRAVFDTVPGNVLGNGDYSISVKAINL